jgi:hypothetical protein
MGFGLIDGPAGAERRASPAVDATLDDLECHWVRFRWSESACTNGD